MFITSFLRVLVGLMLVVVNIVCCVLYEIWFLIVLADSDIHLKFCDEANRGLMSEASGGTSNPPPPFSTLRSSVPNMQEGQSICAMSRAKLKDTKQRVWARGPWSHELDDPAYPSSFTVGEAQRDDVLKG